MLSRSVASASGPGEMSSCLGLAIRGTKSGESAGPLLTTSLEDGSVLRLRLVSVKANLSARLTLQFLVASFSGKRVWFPCLRERLMLLLLSRCREKNAARSFSVLIKPFPFGFFLSLPLGPDINIEYPWNYLRDSSCYFLSSLSSAIVPIELL